MKPLLIFLLLIPLALVACTGARESAPVDTAPATEEAAPPANPQTAANPASQVEPQMECTLVSDQTEAPAQFVEIFGIREDDWVQGPENAAITIVEYSDFQ